MKFINIENSKYLKICGYLIYASYIYEIGDYYQFRIASEKDGLADNLTHKAQGYFYVYPIFKFHLSSKSVLTWQCGIGFGANTKFPLSILSPSFSFRHEKYNGWIGWIPYRIDEIDNSIYKYGSFTLGAGYKF